MHSRNTILGLLFATPSALSLSSLPSLPGTTGPGKSPLDCRSMVATLSVKSGVEIHPIGEEFDISSASASLAWFPRESFHQKVKQFQLTPSPQHTSSKVIDDIIEMQWDEPGPLAYAEFRINSVVETNNEIIPVRQKVPFPIGPGMKTQDMNQYTRPQRFATQDTNIKNLARSLTAGQDDLYRVVCIIADWVSNNNEYSLESATAEVIKTSGQVLTDKRGKCDELSSLFVSMSRSLGIPCRFASGYAYNDEPDLFTERWVPHTWAEVLFPGIGWIPFDITYKTFGHITAGHVQLTTSLDAEFFDVEYHAHGLDFGLHAIEVETLVGPTKLVPKSRQIDDRILDLSLGTQADEVGFGSDAVVVATVTNQRDHYVATQLQLAHAKDIQLLSPKRDLNICLGPRQKIEIPYFFKMDGQHQKEGYVYNYPFVLTSKLSPKECQVSIIVKSGAPVFFAKR